MKRSSQIQIPLVASVAVGLLAGCRHQPEMQRCVDEQNRVVPQQFCQGQPAAGMQGQGGQGAGTYGGYHGGGIGYIPYRYYYGGTGGWNVGSPVTGGSYTSMGGHSYTTSSSAPHSESTGGRISSGTSRGGFGSTHGGESGGHGGGGGE